MWGKIKKAAKKVGNAIKGGAKKVGNALKKGARGVVQGIKQVVNVLKEALNRIIGIPDFVGSLLGIMPRKKIRVRVIVLADESGPLLAPGDLDASISAMNEVFKRDCRTHLTPSDSSIIAVDDDPAPDYALTVQCDFKGYLDDFGSRGSYFGWRARQHGAGALTGYAAPVTVFIVREQVGSSNGCSFGPLTDYVTVTARIVNVDRLVIAHEVAHACGLWHWNKRDYLMRPDSPHGQRINRLQRSVLRNSRHVTFL